MSSESTGKRRCQYFCWRETKQSHYHLWPGTRWPCRWSHMASYTQKINKSCIILRGTNFSRRWKCIGFLMKSFVHSAIDVLRNIGYKIRLSFLYCLPVMAWAESRCPSVVSKPSRRAHVHTALHTAHWTARVMITAGQSFSSWVKLTVKMRLGEVLESPDRLVVPFWNWSSISVEGSDLDSRVVLNETGDTDVNCPDFVTVPWVSYWKQFVV